MGKLFKRFWNPILSLIWVFLIVAGPVKASENELIYLKNGTVVGCDRVWKGLGNTVWCQESFNLTGYPADEVFLSRTLEIEPMIRSFLRQDQEDFYRSRDLDEVMEKADEGLAMDPGNEYLYSIKAGALAWKGAKGEALTNCLEILDLNPNNPYAHFYIGYLSEAENDLRRARDKYEEACRLNLDDACVRYKEITGYYPHEIPGAINRLLEESKMAFRKKQWQRVVELTSKALELGPESAVAYTNRAGAFFYMGRYEEAIEECNRAISINHSFGLAYNNKGAALEGMGDLSEAIREYDYGCRLGEDLACQNAIRLKAEVPRVVEKLVDASNDSFKKREWDRVIQLASKALELDPENAVAYANRAGAFFYKGQYSDAVKDCTKALEIDPDFGLAYNNKGAALEALGNLTEAIREYETGCKLGNSLACENYKRLEAPGGQ
ncbi:MAG: tetratricopeptide repeat protein [Deltaproteobacteria bacterium]|nr:tetratricopeptide repeat protein [Deltaproteobacteria bacterium]